MNRKVLNKLRAIVAKRVATLNLREELFQRLWVRLWQVDKKQPGHSLSWYLKNCELHLRDFLRAGRSIDAYKRRRRRISFPLESDSGCECPYAAALIDGDVRSEIYMHDIHETLHRLLKAPEKDVLRLLTQGFGIREIARTLHISSRDVIEHRQKIAQIAKKLGTFPCGE